MNPVADRPMFELVLCHRRSRQTGIGVMRDHWRGTRAALVAQLRGALGFERYVQVHRVSRLNTLYLGILASRSWPLGALFSVLQGLPVPPLTGRGGGFEEKWDVVEAFRYGSEAALVQALTSGAGVAALERLSGDARPLVRHGTALLVEVLPLYEEAGLGWPRAVTVFCLRARPPLTRETMLERWRTIHRRLVLSLQPALGYRHYDQLHVRAATELAPAAAALGVPFGDFDGIAWLSHGNEGELKRRLLSPATNIANLRLSKDEVNFIDGRNSALVFGEARALDAP